MIALALLLAVLTPDAPSYETVKAVVAERSDIANPSYAVSPGSCWSASTCYNVDSCGLEDDLGMPGTDVRTTLGSYAKIATEASYFEAPLKHFGYPRTLWEPVIHSFESYEVSRLGANETKDAFAPWSSSIFARLAPQLEAYARAHPGTTGLRLASCPLIIHEITVAPLQIKADPAPAQIYVIPEFFYRLCTAQHLNALDVRSCTHWREVLAGEAEPFSGAYYYQVRWHDGTVRQGTLDADAVDSEVVLKKP